MCGRSRFAYNRAPMPSNNDAHLVMRVAPKSPEGVDVVAAHREVAAAKGKVWIAKIGKTLGERYVDRLNEQLSAGRKTFFYLVTTKAGGRTWYRGTMSAIAKRQPFEAKESMPAYYEKERIPPFASLWVCVKGLEPIKPEQLKGVVVESSSREVVEVIQACRTPICIVTAGKKAEA